ncbi:hypothetical protein BX589_11484 [Paraburkholderia fungorum]|jgi:hypothetical protein|uniref:hypothetical protein n=1 Tax=Paraburkholderia fungorum TaxID=134537 RepID=UPI000D418DDB|nr:hypothetical protein [Paraburkholderia fungorum]PRZ52410.1 hypothetical protein BX589_11484 [Paraburkholderia fungorum]
MNDLLKMRTNRGWYVYVVRRDLENTARTLLRLYNARGEPVHSGHTHIHRENLDPTGSATAVMHAGLDVLGPDLNGYSRASDVKREISRLKQDPANYQIRQVGTRWIGVCNRTLPQCSPEIPTPDR